MAQSAVGNTPIKRRTPHGLRNYFPVFAPERTRLETYHCTQCSNSKTTKTFAAKAKWVRRFPMITFRGELRPSPRVQNALGSIVKKKAPNAKNIAAITCRRFVIRASSRIRDPSGESFRGKRLTIEAAEKSA